MGDHCLNRHDMGGESMAGISWNRRVRRAGAAAFGSLVLAGGFLGVGMTAASAAPSGPNVTTGTFTCPGGLTGTFVVPGNSSSMNANAADWSVAHLTIRGDGQGIFVPTEFHLTGTVGGKPVFTRDAVKGSAPSSITCTIASTPEPTPGGVFQVAGTVTGKVVTNG
jgi:hypothetical protein